LFEFEEILWSLFVGVGCENVSMIESNGGLCFFLFYICAQWKGL